MKIESSFGSRIDSRIRIPRELQNLLIANMAFRHFTTPHNENSATIIDNDNNQAAQSAVVIFTEVTLSQQYNTKSPILQCLAIC